MEMGLFKLAVAAENITHTTQSALDSYTYNKYAVECHFLNNTVSCVI